MNQSADRVLPEVPESTKLKLNKACMESLVLYAHGLVSLSGLSNRLAEEDISITHVTTTFTSDCTTISSGIREANLYFHLARITDCKDDLNFPIIAESCVVNL